MSLSGLRSLFPRHHIALIVTLSLVVVFVVGFFFMTYRNRAALHDFYEPKLLAIRVGGVMVYPRPNGAAEVMAGLPIEISCDVVSPGNEGEESHFVVQGAGTTVDVPECKATLTWNGKPGETGAFSVEYRVKAADGADHAVDRREATVGIVPQREYFRIHALEDGAQHRLETLSVPRSVVPYVDAALRLEGKPDDYAVLFFVRKQGALSPVLQITVPPENPKAFRPIVAPLRRFRSWGGDLIGYAAWPGGLEVRKNQQPESIQVGNQDEVREAFELFAGLFRAADVRRVTEAAISLKEVAGDKAVFQVKGVLLETLRQIAYKGWLTEPVTVVRTEVAPEASKFEWKVE